MSPGGTARRVFAEEARDLLIDLEEALLELESHPDDAGLMARVFRALHTLKGTGAMFGFDAVARFTHEVEDLFDAVRRTGIPATAELLATGLDAKDLLQTLLHAEMSARAEEDAASGPMMSETASAPLLKARERELLDRISRLAAAWGAGSRQGGATAASSLSSVSSLSSADMAAAPAEGLALPGRTADGSHHPGAGDMPRSDVPVGAGDADHAIPHACWIRYAPSADALRRGLDPSRLVDGLRQLGELHLWPHCEDVPSLDALDVESVCLRWNAILVTSQPVVAVREPFAVLLDDGGFSVVDLGDADRLPPADVLCRAGAQGQVADAADLLVRAGASADAVQRLRRGVGFDGASAPQGQAHAPGEFAPVGGECAPLPADDILHAGSGRPGQDEAHPSTLRVDSGKVDRLIENVGELVILQSRLSRIAADHEDSRLRELAEGLERLTESLRDSTMSVRMVPLDATFGSFRRLVRDLAARLGKEVRFVAEGGETELDKSVIDHLRDPLLHLVRNAMDHGVEPAEARLAAGKPAEAVLRLSAAHAGGDVVITVSDDGAGIDFDRLRAVGVRRGLLAADANPGEAELLQLLFVPGFSTSSGVSDLSGRGVGLDVVNTALGALRGSVDVETRSGRGTAWRLRIPLTLAIIDGLRVRVGEESFILPLTQVEACLERFVKDEVATLGLVEYRDRLVPCLSLRRFLGVPGSQPAYERIIIATVDGQPVGFAVDGVAGLEQAVIKRLGGPCRRAAWIAGSCVDAEGGISLILDAAQLARIAQGSQER